MKQLMQAFMVVGAVMVLTGAAVYITGWTLAPYVYTIGAALFAVAQINTPARAQSMAIRRLRRQQILGQSFWCSQGPLCSLRMAMSGLSV